MQSRNESIDTQEKENDKFQPGQQASQDSWYLVRAASKRRNSFLKFLELTIAKNSLQEIIVEIEIPQALVYEDIVLISLSNFKAAYSHLHKVEYFQGIERRPLKPEEVSRMLGAK